MTHAEIRSYRLYNQRLSGIKFTKPQEVISWLVAMQAQEFAMTKWAIGLRSDGLTDTLVEKAFNDGEILRTHLMRPTWLRETLTLHNFGATGLFGLSQLFAPCVFNLRR